MRAMLRRVWRVVRETAREIADERAYARYLEARGEGATGRGWREFSERRMREKYGRPKCC